VRQQASRRARHVAGGVGGALPHAIVCEHIACHPSIDTSRSTICINFDFAAHAYSNMLKFSTCTAVPGTRYSRAV
jgi:hypothetical protein